MDITILIPKIKPPEQPDIITSQLKNIFSKLQEKCNLKLVWIIFQPKPFNEYNYENSRVIDYHKFKNAVDIIDEIKPDLIINEVRLGINGIAFGVAAKFKKVPNVTITPTGESEFFSSLYSAKSNLQLVMSDNVLADISDEKNKKKFGMLRYSFGRYFFLLNTLRKTKYNFIDLLKFVCFYPWVQIFSKSYPALNKITSGNLNFCFNQHWYHRLISAGFEQSSILNMGDPAFDNLYHIIKNETSKPTKKTDSTNILFCPTPMHEHGWLTKEEEEKIIIQTIKKISESNAFDISLKIHPSSSSYDEYKKMLKDNQISIPLLQKENIIELLHNCDIMLTYGSSNVILDAILIKKPVLLLRFPKHNELSRLSDSSIINECDDINNISQIINKSLKKSISEDVYDKYITKQIGKFDGKNAEKISNLLLELVNKKKSSE